MKCLISKDGSVYNFIHENGIQTSIKVSQSGHFTKDHVERDNPIFNDKEKYSIVLSSSVGCPLKCQFCHLTKIDKGFRPIEVSQRVANIIECVEYVAEHTNISNKYVKLCFMGEGEALFNTYELLYVVGILLQTIIQKGFAIGVDGVDVSTSLPRVKTKAVVENLNHLNEYLTEEYKSVANPHNYNQPDRSLLRLFYSLHHFDQSKRDLLIPNTKKISEALEFLSMFDKINRVVHYMFIEGVNDSVQDIESLINFINGNDVFLDVEFRVLRYNKFSNDRESDRFSEIMKTLEDSLRVRTFKIQFSAGEDVAAACGMFL